jgi:hypothetical protein
LHISITFGRRLAQLSRNRCHLKINYREATEFIISVAKYNSDIIIDQVRKWLDTNCVPIDEKETDSYLNKAFVNVMLGEEHE